MPEIEQLIDDIADTLEQGKEEVAVETKEKYANLFAEMLEERLKPRPKEGKGTLRMSNIGKPCDRQIWYDVNQPYEKIEPLKAATKLKFLYGDLTELLMLYLAEVSGHSVEGTQDVQEIEGIKGHRDAVIDGVLTDVKSASTYGFAKFADGTLRNNDSFGYFTQGGSYLKAGEDDDLVKDKNRFAFLALDKSLGHFCLDIHHQDETIDYEELYRQKKAMVDQPEPPERAFTDVPEGTSGNMKLPTACSYCAHKWKCYPNLRMFIYSNGPKYLTVVEKEPKVPEAEPEFV